MSKLSSLLLRRDFPFAPIIAFLLSLSLFVSGCTTLTSVPVPGTGLAAAPFAVHVGDRVEVRTKTGHLLAFTVTAIEPAALVGETTKVKFDEIATLQVRRPDKRATTLTVIGVVVLVLLVGTASALAKTGAVLAGG